MNKERCKGEEDVKKWEKGGVDMEREDRTPNRVTLRLLKQIYAKQGRCWNKTHVIGLIAIFPTEPLDLPKKKTIKNRHTCDVPSIQHNTIHRPHGTTLHNTSSDTYYPTAYKLLLLLPHTSDTTNLYLSSAYCT